MSQRSTRQFSFEASHNFPSTRGWVMIRFSFWTRYFPRPTNTARTKWRQTNKTHRSTHTKKIKPPNCPRLANCIQCAGPRSGLVKTLCTDTFGVLWIWLGRICIAACAASIENTTTGVCEAARCRKQACQGRTRHLHSRIAGRRKMTNGHKRKKNKSI